MSVTVDWKFVVTFIATLAGVVIPVALWQADLSSKALSFEVISTAGLDPAPTSQMQGLLVSIDGTPVPNAFLSVLLLSNTGSKPIASTEFEAPLEIRTAASGTKIVRSQVASTAPTDLRPTVASTEDAVSVQPLLLNPKDSVKLTVLTSGPQPTFLVRSRIAGVKTVEVTDKSSTRAARRAWAQSIAGVLLMTVYLVQMSNALQAHRRGVTQPWNFATAIVSAFGATLLLIGWGTSEDFSTLTADFALKAAPAIPLALAVMYVMRRRGRSAA
jgi:hypothetical protein